MAACCPGEYYVWDCKYGSCLGGGTAFDLGDGALGDTTHRIIMFLWLATQHSKCD